MSIQISHWRGGILRSLLSPHGRTEQFRSGYLLPFMFALMSGCSTGELLNSLSGSSNYLAHEDVKYGSHPRQKMDIYLPAGKSKKDAHYSCKVIFVHGGSWQSGEKGFYGFVGAAFAELGYLTAIPNYRLHPEVVFPDFVTDLVNALAHPSLKKEKPEDKIVLVGHSAGALNAAHASYDTKHLINVGLDKSAIDLFVSLAGPHDYFLPSDKPAWRAIFGSTDAQQLQGLSVSYVDFESPTTLILHGDSDKVVTPRSAFSLAKQLESHNIPHHLKIYEGIGHRRIIAALASPLTSIAPTLGDIAQFLHTNGCEPD